MAERLEVKDILAVVGAATGVFSFFRLVGGDVLHWCKKPRLAIEFDPADDLKGVERRRWKTKTDGRNCSRSQQEEDAGTTMRCSAEIDLSTSWREAWPERICVALG